MDEGQTVELDGSASIDPDGDALKFEWDLDNDGTFDTSSASPTTRSWKFPYGPAAATVALRVSDSHGAYATAEATISVDNVAPTVSLPTVPTDPIPTGTLATASWAFTDPAGSRDAPFACVVDFGEAIETATADGFTCTVTHTYSEAGIYLVTNSVADKDGGTGTVGTETPIVVFDPDGGFVTGAGRIDSPLGAYVPDPALAGDASFAFVSKYRKGATLPSGITQFRFETAALDFSSTVYDWLVVTGKGEAQFKGMGTLNGAEGYRFMVWAGDDTVDTLRIRIWTEDDTGAETVLYDNGVGQPIAAGNIIVHAR